MAGLQSLMQGRGGNMPGQAGAFTAIPAQQGRNPIAYTRALKQIPPEDLIRIYNDTNDMRPKWAVASAYADAMKAKALQQGAMGQQAQAQNAAEQQTPPVADQVMAVMAASGGEMKAYAPGGAVDDVDPDIVAETDPQFGGMRLESLDDPVEKERDRIRNLFNIARQVNNQSLMNMYLKENPWLAREQKPPAAQPAAAGSRSTGGGAPTALVQTTPTAPAATSNPSDGTRYENLLEREVERLAPLMRQGAQVTPEVQQAREQLARMRARQLATSQQDAEKIRSEGIRQLQGRLDAARRPLMDDPEALLSLAASINPQRGKTMGSLTGGLASILGQRRARAEKAEEGISALSEKVRLLNAQYQEAAALEDQRKLAILEKDEATKRDVEIRMQQLRIDMRKTQAEIVARREDVAARRDAATGSRESAAATREGAELMRLQQAIRDKEVLLQRIEKAHAEKYGTLYQLAGLSGANEDTKKRLEDAKAELAAQRKALDDAFDPGINQMRQRAGVPMPTSTGAAGWAVTEIKQ